MCAWDLDWFQGNNDKSSNGSEYYIENGCSMMCLQRKPYGKNQKNKEKITLRYKTKHWRSVFARQNAIGPSVANVTHNFT